MTRSTKLAELIVNETSGVDHPAHLHEGWLVIKNAAAATTEGETVELNVTEQPAAEQVVETEDLRKEVTTLLKQVAELSQEKDALLAERELEKAAEVTHAWAILPGFDAAGFAPSLVELRKALPHVAEQVEKAFAASARAIAESGVLKEIGTSATDEVADAWGKIESLANDLVARGEAASFAKAVTIVAERNKDIYNQYITEKGF